MGADWDKASYTCFCFFFFLGIAFVNGLIAGASYISERYTTVSFTGNSHINIRNLQPADGEAMTQHLASDFVAGGHVVADLAGSTVRFDGHTHVGVYLDDSVTGSFSRHIVGGNVSMGGTVGSSLSHAHVGSVFLHVGNGVVFDKVVAGGHYAGNAQGRYSITGMSQLTISGGHYTNAVTAGTYIDRVSNTSEVDVLSSSLQISGGIYDGTVSGASYVRIGSDAGTTFTHADVYVRVSGGHLNKGLVGGLSLGNATAVADIGLIGMELVGGVLNGPITGGVYAAASTVRSVTGTVENVDISLEGATVNGNLYGGAFLAREATNASLTVNNVGISVFAGTLNGNIYAAGAQRGASALVVGNTHVTLSLGADFAEGVVVSGGFETALGTVTGTRSLTLQGTATTIEDANGLIRVADYHNVTVRDFDRVSNAGDVSIARLEGDKVIHKDGAGTLTVGALGENSRLALDGGALRLASVENLTSVSGSGALLLHTQGTVQAGEMMQKSAGLEGGLTMESGTLAVSGEVQTLAQGIHMGGAGLGMADGSTLSGALELDAATTATVQGAASISAAISGDSLAVEGTGTLTLMSGNSMSSLAVNGGTVVAGSASALGKGTVSVAAGATLALDAAVSELTTLTLADGATLALNGSLAGKTVLEADNIALSGNLTLKFNGALTTGDTFTLAGAVASSAIWNIVTEERSSISTFVSGDSIVFTVNSAGAATLVWNGENGAVWNHENTAWLNADKADSFITNDHVSFGDADTRNVTVTSEGVQVGSLLITADGYNFSGGDISAAQITVMNKVSPEGTPEGTTAHINSVLRSSGDVHYSGSGMLVLSGGQDIAGSLNINSGYVQVLHSEGLAGGVQLEENGTLVLNEAGKEWQGGSIRGTGVVDLMGTYRASDLHDAFVLAAEGPSFQGTIAMEGGSRFIMDADSTAPFADVTFLVEQGSGFLMDTQHALTSDIELTLNGFLGFNRDGVLTGTVTVDGGGTLQVAEGIKATLNGRLVGREDGGELTLLGGGLLEIGGLKGSASLLVQDGDLSVSSAASLGKLTLAGNNTLSLVKGQLLTVDSLELNGDNALAFSGEL